jgi:hypothetical protein
MPPATGNTYVFKLKGNGVHSSAERKDSLVQKKKTRFPPRKKKHSLLHKPQSPSNHPGCRRRWLSGTILASLVLDSTGFWVRISARTHILRNITTGGDITGGFCPGAGFPSCHKSIYRVSEDNFRGSACVSEWMLISVKRWGVGLS